jgi:histidyl-tRNA synthetase
MKKTPVKGTRDYLPEETALRDHLQSIILGTYRDAGFSRITTPILESAENLDKSDGGENLNLIFRVLKRGKKFEEAIAEEHPTEKSVSDMGLRYDLTLPLSRYYANNREQLVTPFKVIQMDRVYRAERPQKGRLREFMQCDIDIIGNASYDAEIDLILTTTAALKKTGLSDFTININDRHILKAIFTYSGFNDEDFEKLAIIFDKLDKIGFDGVADELTDESFDKAAVEKFKSLFADGSLSLDKAAGLPGAGEYADNVKKIIDTVNQITGNEYNIRFSPSLVRGQGYYTGTIFEINVPGYSGAIAGGGRYDNLIGKFTGEDIPAVGFSIGFERLFSILTEQNYKDSQATKRIALFFDDDNMTEAFRLAEDYRKDYLVSVMKRPKKMGKFLDKLEAGGFAGFLTVADREIKMFTD